MATREIKTRFKLEGEQQYKSAMSQAASAVKMLNSEEKLAKAQFQATGDAQAYAAAQADILKRKITEQKSAVAAAEGAIKALTANGVSPASKQFQTWQTKLNTAKTALTQMETQLASVEGGLKTETTATETAAASADTLQKSLKKIGTGVDLASASQAVDSLKDKLEGVISAAARAAKGVFDLGADAGAWADDIITHATELGMDPETYQSWQYAARFIDTSVETISASIQDLNKGMKNPAEFAETMAGIGVAYQDAAGNARPASAIFWDAIDSLHGMTDESTRAEKATKIFGNDWRKLMPLIEAGSGAWNEMTEQAREVAVVSNENVQALGGVDDAVQDFSARFDKLKYDALAALAPTFQQVAEAMSTAVSALDEFVQSEEGQAALAGLNEALAGIITNLVGENGSGFASLVDTAKGAVQGLNDALKWISENGTTVAGIIKGMGVAWGSLKVASTVLEFVRLLKVLPLDKLGSLFGGGSGAGAAGAGAAGAGASGAAGGGAATAGGFFSKVGAFLGSTTAKVLGGAALTTYLVLKPSTTGNDDIFDENGRWIADPDYDVEADPEGIFGGDDAFAAQKAMSEHLIAVQRKRQADAASAAWDYVKGGGHDPFDDVWVELYNAFEGDEYTYEQVANRINEMYEQLQQGADPATVGDFPLADFDLEGAVGAAVDLGERTSEGVAQGIYNKAPEVQTASEYVAQIAQRALRRALDIHSPSKVFAQLGAYTAQGFAEGITGSVNRVEQAVGAMVAATTPQPAATVGGFDLGAMAAGQASGMNEGVFAAAVASAVRDAVSTIVVDMDGVAVGHAVSSTVNGDLGWREYQERYETA